MVKEKDLINSMRPACLKLASVLLIMMLFVVFASPGNVYAKETEPEEPIREVHNVGVGNEAYCFFVTHNVVLTPSEVAELSDEELTAVILERAGLFMKKANCKAASHKAITAEDWTKKRGYFLLSEPDIEGIRAAEPVDGSPVKFYMDLIVGLNAEDEEEGEEQPLYSTFKRTSPRLLFAVVATEEDAKYGEDICKEDIKPDKGVSPGAGIPDTSEDEMLPEYRTINMVDRSGAPIEETLEDGSPVKLEWIEPQNIGGDESQSFLDRIPGGMAGLVAMAAAAAAAVAAFVMIARKKKKDD